ncbi:hypothetical protein BJ508DRAFT_325523 [Ascobolus immersus RN42]|uniref:Uncharacterized protein n=1 Tax=Ascobolus immersus RN42 TaxID=1160509 RepID=A0A3N4I8W3_ASCIM|nr:hypothetical protein BJ508DRAFT_325523 [Ascobolus immersus RN42]
MSISVPLDTNPKFVSEVIFEPASQMMAFTLLNENFGRKLRLELNITDDSITVALMVNPERMNYSINEGVFSDDNYARWWDVELQTELPVKVPFRSVNAIIFKADSKMTSNTNLGLVSRGTPVGMSGT